MSSLTFKALESDQGSLRFALSGSITEASDFGPLFEQTVQELVLDLQGVERINSFGIRDWIRHLKRLEAASIRVVLERCSPAVVQQLNAVANFAVHARVRSILAPYFCEACGADTVRCIDPATAKARELEAGTVCSGCGAQAEFDDIADEYLSFRDSQR